MTLHRKWTAIAAGMTAAGALLSGCGDKKPESKEPEQEKTLAEVWSKPPSDAHLVAEYYTVKTKNAPVWGHGGEPKSAEPFQKVVKGCVMRATAMPDPQGNLLPVLIYPDDPNGPTMSGGVMKASDLQPLKEPSSCTAKVIVPKASF